MSRNFACTTIPIPTIVGPRGPPGPRGCKGNTGEAKT